MRVKNPYHKITLCYAAAIAGAVFGVLLVECIIDLRREAALITPIITGMFFGACTVTMILGFDGK